MCAEDEDEMMFLELIDMGLSADLGIPDQRGVHGCLDAAVPDDPYVS